MQFGSLTLLQICTMTKLEEIEKAVQQLAPEEIAQLRLWLEEYEADLFDARIEADMRSGKLDSHFERALNMQAADRSKKLP